MSTSQVDKGRVIKFRAWDGNKMHWLDNLWNNHWYDNEKSGYPSMNNTNSDAGRLFASKQLHLMQFTGLYDKHGKEIYEGDLISNGQHVCYVVFIDGCFWLKRDGCTTTNLMYSWPNNCYPMFRVNHATYSEVIGNLHQDKHLLE